MTYQGAKFDELVVALENVYQCLGNFHPRQYDDAVKHLHVRENVSPTSSVAQARRLRTRLGKTQIAMNRFIVAIYKENLAAQEEINRLFEEV